MNRLFREQHIVFISFAIILVQACATVEAAATATTAAEVSATSIPLSQQVLLTSISFKEQGQSPIYTLTAQTPKLTGSDDPRAQTFNKAVDEIVRNEIDYFRENVLAQMPAQPFSSGSFLDAQYMLVFQHRNIWSLKFIFSGYADGAAHPYHYTLTFNFDLERGQALSLADLFPPDSNFLHKISSYCIAQLSLRDIGFYGGFQQGAEPLDKNYRNWNITADGLLITFDEYQVAPYAAGPQTVVVPYSELASLINTKSPLAAFSK
jgi:hypothetical protein